MAQIKIIVMLHIYIYRIYSICWGCLNHESKESGWWTPTFATVLKTYLVLPSTIKTTWKSVVKEETSDKS